MKTKLKLILHYSVPASNISKSNDPFCHRAEFLVYRQDRKIFMAILGIGISNRPKLSLERSE